MIFVAMHATLTVWLFSTIKGEEKSRKEKRESWVFLGAFALDGILLPLSWWLGIDALGLPGEG